MSLEQFRERLRELKGSLISDASGGVSMSRGTLYTWLDGASPRLDAVVKFSDINKLNPVWLITGKGRRDLREEVDLEAFRERLVLVTSGRLKDVAISAGVKLATLKTWVNPSKKFLPRLDGLLAIARAENVSIRWLLTGQGPRTPFEGERDAPREATDHLSPTLPPGAVRVVPATGAQVRKLPFLGRIEAGFSALAIQEAELREFSKWMCPRGDAFALRVHGDSMIDAGIRSGDIVIIRATPRAGDGEVVAATVGEESMLKRVRHDADGWWLVAANRTLTERRPLAGAIIHGVVHMVIRQFGTTPFVVPDDDLVQ